MQLATNADRWRQRATVEGAIKGQRKAVVIVFGQLDGHRRTLGVALDDPFDDVDGDFSTHVPLWRIGEINGTYGRCRLRAPRSEDDDDPESDPSSPRPHRFALGSLEAFGQHRRVRCIADP